MGSVDGHILGINSDMGEGFGLYRVGDDRTPMPSGSRPCSAVAALLHPFRRAERDAFGRSPIERIDAIGGRHRAPPIEPRAIA